MNSSAGLEGQIVRYCEPIYRYCFSRLRSPEDAEDLAQEILTEVVDGLARTRVHNIDAWVWTVARNRFRRRYAERLTERSAVVLSHGDQPDSSPGVEEQALYRETLEKAFHVIIGISEKYRDVLVEYYINGRTYQEIERKLSVPMSTVKWRIHEGRNRFEERWNKAMNERARIYEQIEWDVMCSGSMDPRRYLERQISRAITKAAYDAPKTIEEICDITGIPCLYIEDELDQLLFGEALVEIGDRYAANFIIHRAEDRRSLDDAFFETTRRVAPKLEAEIALREEKIRGIGFYGSDFAFDRLMWIVVPRSLRASIEAARERIPAISDFRFPPRKDGGNGWFVVLEGPQEDFRYKSGQNSYAGTDDYRTQFRYYWLSRYWNADLFPTLEKLGSDKLVDFVGTDGSIDSAMDEAFAARLIEVGLARRTADAIVSTFPVFTGEQDREFMRLMNEIGSVIAPELEDLISRIYEAYQAFTPKRLHDQIVGNISGYLHDLVSMVIEIYQERGVMRTDSASVLVECIRR